MKNQINLLRDIEGFVRFSAPFKADKRQIEEIKEAIYVKTGIDVGFKQLDLTFNEYDASSGLGKSKTIKKWSNSEKKYLILHSTDTNNEIGDVLGRSNMSVHMMRAKIYREFELFLESDEGQKLKSKSKEEQVKHWLSSDDE